MRDDPSARAAQVGATRLLPIDARGANLEPEVTDLTPDLLRRLRRQEHAAAGELARQAGAPGVYVANALLHGEDGTADLRALSGADGTTAALCWVGRRGNLVVLGEIPVDPTWLATELCALEAPWRIALGPSDLLSALARRDLRSPLVFRMQVYHVARQAATEAVDHEVRLGNRADLEVLCEAAIALNEVDLHVPRARVHQSWLQKTVRGRLREGRTFVIGGKGVPVCKLDVGSRGPAGAVIEGVFTAPSARGTGLATRLVREVTRRLLLDHPMVCLHVAEDNHVARRAYERAGLRAEDRCGILLRDG